MGGGAHISSRSVDPPPMPRPTRRAAALRSTGRSRRRPLIVDSSEEEEVDGTLSEEEHCGADSSDGEGSSDEFIVDRIMDKRTKRGVVEYRVRWEGYDSADDTWERIENLATATEAVKEYESSSQAESAAPPLTAGTKGGRGTAAAKQPARAWPMEQTDINEASAGPSLSSHPPRPSHPAPPVSLIPTGRA